MRKAAVVGAGTMGNGIAHVFSQSGWEVALIDVAQPALDRGMAAQSGTVKGSTRAISLAASAQQCGVAP